MDSEWNPIPNSTTSPPPSRYFSVLLQVANSTMRFIPFVIVGTAVTFFNTYAYASPVKSPVSNLDNAGLRQREATWCGGYSNLTCSISCKLEGREGYTCSPEYVQFQILHINSIPYADMQITGTVFGKLFV